MTHGFVYSRERATPRLPQGFRVTKTRGQDTMSALCEVLPHPYGWELRLTVDGRERPMSTFVESVSDVIRAVSRWRVAMDKLGWR